MWVNSQKDNEYFPIHNHTPKVCDISAVMYLKIPKYLSSRLTHYEEAADEFLQWVSDTGNGFAVWYCGEQMNGPYFWPEKTTQLIAEEGPALLKCHYDKTTGDQA